MTFDELDFPTHADGTMSCNSSATRSTMSKNNFKFNRAAKFIRQTVATSKSRI